MADHEVNPLTRPHAGPWIEAELFNHGQRELATEQAARVAGRQLSFGPPIRSIEGMLQ